LEETDQKTTHDAEVSKAFWAVVLPNVFSLGAGVVAAFAAPEGLSLLAGLLIFFVSKIGWRLQEIREVLTSSRP
jgi:hypothetical protein